MKDDSEVREFLIDWITAYKDGAECNALAETPKESADYLISQLSALTRIEGDEDGLIAPKRMREIVLDNQTKYKGELAIAEACIQIRNEQQALTKRVEPQINIHSGNMETGTQTSKGGSVIDG